MDVGRSLLLAAACLALGGCAAQTDYVFAFDGPEADRADAQTAVDEWNACGVVHIELRETTTGLRDTTIERVDDAFAEGRFADHEVKGLTSSDHTLIRYKDQNPVLTQRVLTHEMGHALGLEHAPGGVMEADGAVLHVTAADCDALRAR